MVTVSVNHLRVWFIRLLPYKMNNAKCIKCFTDRKPDTPYQQNSCHLYRYMYFIAGFLA